MAIATTKTTIDEKTTLPTNHQRKIELHVGERQIPQCSTYILQVSINFSWRGRPIPKYPKENILSRARTLLYPGNRSELSSKCWRCQAIKLMRNPAVPFAWVNLYQPASPSVGMSFVFLVYCITFTPMPTQTNMSSAPAVVFPFIWKTCDQSYWKVW